MSNKAYENTPFLHSRDARPLRILAEYLEPYSRFDRHAVADTIVFMGSARLQSREQAEMELKDARARHGDVEAADRRLAMSRYYEAARELAHRLTNWSKSLPDDPRRFVVCTGGGPGVMEAANRGASEAKGLNVGLSITLPMEENTNRFITRQLSFDFHYFFMRKFWFVYLAKAVIFFPGGFGTLDELFEILTLLQTGKLRKRLPLVLFGSDYWERVVDFDALVEFGTISAEDRELLFRSDSVDEVYAHLVSELTQTGLENPGATL